MNILYNTTIGWNPGDELIFAGVKNIMDRLYGRHNRIIYNRHPLYERKPGDNCYTHPLGSDYIDHIIFAGTPEWNSPTSLDMYKLIKENNVPFSYVGVGSSFHHPSVIKELYGHEHRKVKHDRDWANKNVFSKATHKIVRDKNAQRDIYGSNLICCPAFFADPKLDIETKTSKNKVVVCVQFDTEICGVDPYIAQTVRDFAAHNGLDTVCHNYEDFRIATASGLQPYYSTLSSDYFDFYKDYDLVISPRVHACGWASTLGIPSITIPHDERSQTTKHFGSTHCDIFSIQSFFDKVDDKWILEQSKKVIQLKKEKMDQFLFVMSENGLELRNKNE
jgi:hypothetical protein